MASWPYSTAAWQRLRRLKLTSNPLCEACEDQGRISPATDVDHIKAINQGGAAFPEITGLRALCHSCHSIKTNAVELKRGIKGCDEDGVPLDPDHPYRRPCSAARMHDAAGMHGDTPSKDEKLSKSDRRWSSKTQLVSIFGFPARSHRRSSISARGRR